MRHFVNDLSCGSLLTWHDFDDELFYWCHSRKNCCDRHPLKTLFSKVNLAMSICDAHLSDNEVLSSAFRRLIISLIFFSLFFFRIP